MLQFNFILSCISSDLKIANEGTNMPYISKRPKLKRSTQEIEQLERIRNSLTRALVRVERAKNMLL